MERRALVGTVNELIVFLGGALPVLVFACAYRVGGLRGCAGDDAAPSATEGRVGRHSPCSAK